MRRIAEKLGRLFPQLDTQPEFAWTGAFGTTTTGLPYIGADPADIARILAVMGYGGNGITFSQIASELVPTAIEGLPTRTQAVRLQSLIAVLQTIPHHLIVSLLKHT